MQIHLNNAPNGHATMKSSTKWSSRALPAPGCSEVPNLINKTALKNFYVRSWKKHGKSKLPPHKGRGILLQNHREKSPLGELAEPWQVSEKKKKNNPHTPGFSGDLQNTNTWFGTKLGQPSSRERETSIYTIDLETYCTLIPATHT